MDDRPATSLAHEVETRSAPAARWPERAGVSTPSFRTIVALADGSMAARHGRVDGRPLDSFAPVAIDAAARCDVAGGRPPSTQASSPTGRCRAANVLVVVGVPDADRPRRRSGSRQTSAGRAIDRAELLASLAVLVGAERCADSIRRAGR